MDFNTAFERLIGHEGGLVDHPNDPGGLTKYGISQRSYPTEDIRGLTLERAKVIYRRDYWDRLRLDELTPSVRFALFDAAVNSGPGQAVRFLQRAVGVADDGHIGPVTMAEIARRSPDQLNARINAVRLQFMTDLSTWPSFGKGWARRIAANILGS